MLGVLFWFQVCFQIIVYLNLKKKKLGDNDGYVYRRYIDNDIIFYFNDSNTSLLPTKYPTQLTLTQNDMINNLINFFI